MLGPAKQYINHPTMSAANHVSQSVICLRQPTVARSLVSQNLPSKEGTASIISASTMNFEFRRIDRLFAIAILTCSFNI